MPPPSLPWKRGSQSWAESHTCGHSCTPSTPHQLLPCARHRGRRHRASWGDPRPRGGQSLGGRPRLQPTGGAAQTRRDRLLHNGPVGTATGRSEEIRVHAHTHIQKALAVRGGSGSLLGAWSLKGGAAQSRGSVCAKEDGAEVLAGARPQWSYKETTSVNITV